MPQISDVEFARLKQSLEELTTLNRIASAINISMSVDEITSTIVEHCCRRVSSSQGAIFLLDQEEESVDKFKTFVRETSAADQVPFHLSQSLQGWMLKNKCILVSNDPDNDDRLRGVSFSKIGLKHIIAAPLLSRRGLLGVLVLFNKSSDTGFDQQDQRFLGIVSTQVAKVIENARLFEKEIRLAAIEKEIRVAKTIQEGFLPKENPVLPQLATFGLNISAREVGGDYYDLVQLSSGKMFFSLGDVSGKGLPAALLTGNAMAVLRSQLYTSDEVDLAAVANCLNQLIFHFTSPEQYITAILGMIDSENGLMSFVNAGHLPPIVVRADGSVEMPTQSDLVIGVLPDVSFQVHEIAMEPNDTVYLYTDGVTEAFDEHAQQFGDERLLSILSENRGKTPEVVCRIVRDELERYRGSAAQSDDITIISFSRR